MLFEKLESKLDQFGHSPKLILAEFDFFDIRQNKFRQIASKLANGLPKLILGDSLNDLDFVLQRQSY